MIWICPICGFKGSRDEFKDYRDLHHVRCPVCESFRYHRAMALYLEQLCFISRIRVLDVSATPQIERVTYQFPDWNYFGVDIIPGKADIRGDIQDLPFRNELFDLVISLHTLEHVPNDRRAVEQLHRVTRRGGTCLIMVPVREGLTDARETTTMAQRREFFGDEYHLRFYGKKDFPGFLESPGWKVTADDWLARDGKDLVDRHGLRPDEIIYRCEKV